jgi:Protein of unknown function (DUF433)
MASRVAGTDASGQCGNPSYAAIQELLTREPPLQAQRISSLGGCRPIRVADIPVVGAEDRALPTMNFAGYFQRDPEICGGETILKGTRVTLRTILASLAD